MSSFCCCGTQASYPHKPDCPFPYFGNNEEKVKEWYEKREWLKDWLKRSGDCPECHGKGYIVAYTGNTKHVWDCPASVHQEDYYD